VNNKALRKLGVPEICLKACIQGIQSACIKGHVRTNVLKNTIKNVLALPGEYADHEHWGDFAKAVIENNDFVRPEPIDYKTWGGDQIEESCHGQMKQACSLPDAVGAALMPDAHLGYGLPIGGVLALKNAVCPYAVGVDIACRMKLSVLDLPVTHLDSKFNLFKEALEKGTRFGIGNKGSAVYDQPRNHPVLDDDWSVTSVTKDQKDKAVLQLGTSGSGNHFVEFGLVTIPDDHSHAASDPHVPKSLTLPAGQYVAVMSHSGSRGPGSTVCQQYSAIAQMKLDPRYKEDLGRLAWLSLDSEEGQEYWLAMELMGRFAAANHDVIHKQLAKLTGAEVLWDVENHHNFAWKEMHSLDVGEVIVHRKGATPAGPGVLGVIPGSMATPAFIVRGMGNPDSLYSASHGAGRVMSRKKAKDKYNWKAVREDLARKGVRVLSAGADEVPGVYKNIHNVMMEQADLVEIVAQFDPKIVRMCGDGSRSED